MPDTTSESAKFDLFGTYAATLDGTAGPTSIDDLSVVRGNVTLRANGLADAVLVVTGDASLAGTVTLAEVGGTHLDLQVQGGLSTAAGSYVAVEGGPISAASTTIAGGAPTMATQLVLHGSAANLGDVVLAPAGSSTSRGGFDIFDGSVVATKNLSIAASDPSSRGELNVNGSTLTQAGTSTTTIGVSSIGGSGAGFFSVSGGGTAELATVVVNATGKLLNSGGAMKVTKSLAVVGGEYRESGAATRDFTAATSIAISDGGKMTLVSAPLTLAPGKTLTLSGGEFTSAGGVEAAGGRLEFGAGESTVSGAITITGNGHFTVGPNAVVHVHGDYLNVGGPASVAPGSTVVFHGEYRSIGMGSSGNVRFEGDARPHSSATSLGGNVEWAVGSRLVAPFSAGSGSPAFYVNGVATVAGGLAIVEGPSAVDPVAGDRLTLLRADSIIGAFSGFEGVSLAAGLEWRLEQTPTTVTAVVVSPSVTGDFNYDGVVDAADYTVWRDTAGSDGPLMAADANGDSRVDQADYLAWQASYGAQAGQAIPEPATIVAFLGAGVASLCRPRRRRLPNPAAGLRLNQSRLA